jgi:hypothetical protein
MTPEERALLRALAVSVLHLHRCAPPSNQDGIASQGVADALCAFDRARAAEPAEQLVILDSHPACPADNEGWRI